LQYRLETTGTEEPRDAVKGCQWRSEEKTVIVPVLKSVARKRIVENVIELGHYFVCNSEL
jgi:hypothetical protein